MLKRPLLARLLWLGPFQETVARGRAHTLHLRVALSPLSQVTSARGTGNSGGAGGGERGESLQLRSVNWMVSAWEMKAVSYRRRCSWD